MGILDAPGPSKQEAQNTAGLHRLAIIGAADRASSAAASAVAFTDAKGLTETWANLTNWVTTAGGVQVSNNRLYAAGGGGGGKQLMTAAQAGGFRLTSEITFIAGGGSASDLTLVGLNASADDTTGTIAGGNNLVAAIGIRPDGTPIKYGNAAGGVASLGAALTGSTTLSVTIVGDSTNVTMVLANADSSVYYRVTVPRSSVPNARAAVYNQDARGTSGNYIRSLNIKAGPAYASHSPAQATTNQWSRYAVAPSGYNAVIGLPGGWDSRKPLPVVIYAHGSGDLDEDVTKTKQPNAIGPVAAALVNAGYLVAASDFSGQYNWGNAAALTAMEELYRHLRDSYPIGPIILMGHSMGGLVSLTTLARRVIPGIVGYVGIEAVYSLSAEYALSYQTAIKTAYGIAADGSDYATKTAGYDPALRKGWEFRGVPMWLIGSPDDTNVYKAQNMDKLVAAVTPYTTDLTTFTASGPHVDPSEFRPTDVVAFCNRVSRT